MQNFTTLIFGKHAFYQVNISNQWQFSLLFILRSSCSIQLVTVIFILRIMLFECPHFVDCPINMITDIEKTTESHSTS